MTRFHPARLVSSCAGAGFSPVAPGTAGAAVGVALFWLGLRSASVPVQLLATAVVSVLGVLAADRVCTALGVEDPSEVVIDELAGMWLSLIAAPASVAWWVAAFLLFRFFDILKPFPVRQAEALHGGLGIMADDLVAGAYSWLALQILALWLPLA